MMMFIVFYEEVRYKPADLVFLFNGSVLSYLKGRPSPAVGPFVVEVTQFLPQSLPWNSKQRPKFSTQVRNGFVLRRE